MYRGQQVRLFRLSALLRPLRSSGYISQSQILTLRQGTLPQARRLCRHHCLARILCRRSRRFLLLFLWPIPRFHLRRGPAGTPDYYFRHLALLTHPLNLRICFCALVFLMNSCCSQAASYKLQLYIASRSLLAFALGGIPSSNITDPGSMAGSRLKPWSGGEEARARWGGAGGRLSGELEEGRSNAP